MAQDGIARAVWPSHAPMDGDTVFAVVYRARDPLPHGHAASIDLMWIGHLAALCLSRAIARGDLPRHPGAGGSRNPPGGERFG
jgi:L-aminopeptidase/D-esterase-like protein